jgi:hypothetical protein
MYLIYTYGSTMGKTVSRIVHISILHGFSGQTSSRPRKCMHAAEELHSNAPLKDECNVPHNAFFADQEFTQISDLRLPRHCRLPEGT